MIRSPAAAAALLLAGPALAGKSVVTANRFLDVATGRFVDRPAKFRRRR